MIALLLAASLAPNWVEICHNPVTQSDMTTCAGIAYEKSDALLNAQWSDTMAAMRRADSGGPHIDGRKGSADQLRTAQRAWLSFRDEHCISEGYAARGGSMEPMLVALCKARLTDERVQQLRALTNGLAE